MPISIVCPNGHKLSAQDGHAGKKLRCPKCRAEIQVPASKEADEENGLIGFAEPDEPPPTRVPAADDAEDAPRKKRKRKTPRQASTPGLEGVDAKLDLGLRLYKYCLVLQVLFVVLVFWSIPLAEIESAGRIMPWVFRGLLIASGVLGLVGSILCLWAPSDSGARGFVIASLILAIASPFMVAFAANLLPFFARLPTVAQTLQWGGLIFLMYVMSLSSWIALMLSMRKLSDYLDKPDLMDDALLLPVLMVGWGGLFIVIITAAMLAVSLDFAGPGLLLIVLYVSGIASVVVLVSRLVKNVEFIDKLRNVVKPQKV